MTQLTERLAQTLPTIEDCRRRAKARLPGFIYDFLEGGTDREEALHLNCAAFSDIRMSPRVGRAIEHPQLGVRLFDREWDVPVGVSPCGYVDLIEPGTEIGTAQAAQERRAPFIASMSSIAPLEDLAAAAPDSLWLQVLQSRNTDIVRDIIARADAVGVKVLVVTMDIPMSSQRNRDIRNGFTLPLRPNAKLVRDVVQSPGWFWQFLKRPQPMPGNFIKYIPKGASVVEAAAALEHEADFITTWDDLAQFRGAWASKLVVKGIQTEADARQALEMGADGIIVSNHGGRQFDAGRPSIVCLPEIVAAVGDSIPVMLDSGVRSGLDVFRAMHLGAQMVFSGRSFYYAAGALGRTGANHAFEIFRRELEIVMRQAGVSSIGEVHE